MSTEQKKKVAKEISLFLVAQSLSLCFSIRVDVVCRTFERVRCLTRKKPDLYGIQWLHIFDVCNETSCFCVADDLYLTRNFFFTLNRPHQMKSGCHGDFHLCVIALQYCFKCHVKASVVQCENREIPTTISRRLLRNPNRKEHRNTTKCDSKCRTRQQQQRQSEKIRWTQ